jgi:hypothetical protein
MKGTMLYNKRIDFKVDEDMYQWIKNNSHQNNISMAQVIRNVLDTFTERKHGVYLTKEIADKTQKMLETK